MSEVEPTVTAGPVNGSGGGRFSPATSWTCGACGYIADPGRKGEPTLDPAMVVIWCVMCRKKTVHRARR